MAKKSKRCDHAGEIYTNNAEYVKYTSVYKSIMKHIVIPNTDYDVDIFIHCWNVDLEEELVSLYKPTKYIFEDNNKYADEINSQCIVPKDFGGISHSLSVRKVLELQEEYSIKNGIEYDIVVLFRPDVLIWSDMIFSKYDLQYFYTDGHDDNNGEFYFVMSPEHAVLFKDLYLSLKYNNRYSVHSWIKNFLIKYCNFSIKGDILIPGKHFEVLRHIYQTSILNGHITYDLLEEYDILPRDIEQRVLY
jgi:hypothetical protein